MAQAIPRRSSPSLPAWLVTDGALETFDPTVLLNGQYVVRFSSTDNAGQTATTTSTVDVSRNTKVGNFTLSFNDLSVPLRPADYHHAHLRLTR